MLLLTVVSVLIINPTVELLKDKTVTQCARVVSVPQQSEYILLSTPTLCSFYAIYHSVHGMTTLTAICSSFPCHVLSAFAMGALVWLCSLEMRTACLLTCRNDSSTENMSPLLDMFI